MGFSRGISFFVEGFRRAFSGDVGAFILLPAATSMLIVGIGLYFAYGYIESLTVYLTTISWWPDWLSAVIEPLLYILVTLVSAWVFGFVAVIVGSPFHGDLNNRIDPVPEPVARRWYEIIWETLKRELRKLRYTLPRLLGLLLCGFIPVINVAAPFLWLTYGGWLMAVQFCDFSFENRERPFTETLATLRRQRSACIGLGACISLGLSIPLLNFVIAPVAVVAAALFNKAMRQTA